MISKWKEILKNHFIIYIYLYVIDTNHSEIHHCLENSLSSHHSQLRKKGMCLSLFLSRREPTVTAHNALCSSWKMKLLFMDKIQI